MADVRENAAKALAEPAKCPAFASHAAMLADGPKLICIVEDNGPVFTANLKRFIAGEPPQNLVDKELGY